MYPTRVMMLKKGQRCCDQCTLQMLVCLVSLVLQTVFAVRRNETSSFIDHLVNQIKVKSHRSFTKPASRTSPQTSLLSQLLVKHSPIALASVQNNTRTGPLPDKNMTAVTPRYQGNSMLKQLLSSDDPAVDAVCFVGQFPRASIFTKRVQEHLSDGIFDAFVACSTQQGELDDAVVSKDALCRNLQSIGGFRNCTVDLRPYNASKYFDAVRGLAPLQLTNYIYPYRVASMFHTISRCIKMVEQFDPPIIHRYIFVTRFDTLTLFQAHSKEFWAKAQINDLTVARRRVGADGPDPNQVEVEDTFYFGKLLCVSSIYIFLRFRASV